MRSAFNVGLTDSDRVLTFLPHRNCGPIEGFEPLVGKQFSLAIDSPPADLGKALEQAIAQCE
jgi:hypothetical protein